MNGNNDDLIREIHAVVHATASTVSELPRKHDVTESIHDAIREHTKDCRKRVSRSPGSQSMDPIQLAKWIVIGLAAAAGAAGSGVGINALF